MKKLILILLLPLFTIGQDNFEFVNYLDKPIDSLPFSNVKETFSFPAGAYNKATGDFEFLGIPFDTLEITTTPYHKIEKFTFRLEESFSPYFRTLLKEKYGVAVDNTHDKHEILEKYQFDLYDRMVQSPDKKHADCLNGKPMYLTYFKNTYQISIRCDHKHLFRPPAMLIDIVSLTPIAPLSYLGMHIKNIPKFDYPLEQGQKKYNMQHHYRSLLFSTLSFLDAECTGISFDTNENKIIEEVSISFYRPFNKSFFEKLEQLYGEGTMYLWFFNVTDDIVKRQQLTEKNIVYSKKNKPMYMKLKYYEDIPDYIVFNYGEYKIQCNITDLSGGFTIDFKKASENTPF